MQKQFFILIGRSGCGKGTQAELLQKYLEGQGTVPTSLEGFPSTHEATTGHSAGQGKVVHVTTGGGFRDFVARDTYVSSLSRAVNESGELQPEFLAVWNWSDIFINTLKGGETVILDGAPRKPFEVGILHSAITFMGYERPTVIYVDVSENWAKERLLGRGRDDDKDEAEVAKRLEWFETDVLPALEEYMKDPRYKVLHINGEQTVEEVHNEIVSKLSNA